MTRLPPLRAREVVKGLQALGFEKVRQKGSHAIFHHSDCRRTGVAIHAVKSISPYLLSDILKHLDISDEEFLQAMGRKL
jgi:predicted RNA binding protein YcfA (HicA-like mRNA interferase family)